MVGGKEKPLRLAERTEAISTLGLSVKARPAKEAAYATGRSAKAV
jgi:hypothetical protein